MQDLQISKVVQPTKKIENPIKKLLESIEESESEEDLEVTKIINKLMKVNPFESRGKKRQRKVVDKWDNHSEDKRHQDTDSEIKPDNKMQKKLSIPMTDTSSQESIFDNYNFQDPLPMIEPSYQPMKCEISHRAPILIQSYSNKSVIKGLSPTLFLRNKMS